MWILVIVSHLIFFLTGLFAKKYIINFFKNRYENIADIKNDKGENNKVSSPNSKTVTAYFHKKFQLIKDTPDPITIDDISINIKQEQQAKTSSKPNFIALTVLWSHFKASRQHVLGKNVIPPWQRLDDVNTKEQKEWIHFLNNIIKDKSWTGWINNPEEVKRRSLKAYKKIKKKEMN